MFTQIHGIKKGSLIKFFCMTSLFVLANCFLITQAFAQGEEQVVNDFADFIVKIFQGPIRLMFVVGLTVAAVITLGMQKFIWFICCCAAGIILLFYPEIIKAFSQFM